MTRRVNSCQSNTGSSTSSDAFDMSPVSQAEVAMISEKFRQRMQPCQLPIWERQCCPCCGRNMRLATESVARFREYIRDTAADALSGEGDFTESERKLLLSDEFLCRMLARCGGEFKRTLERLIIARTVHRKYSLDTFTACQLCINSLGSGYHSFRQVGFDRLGRPVLYTCLNQDRETGTSLEQVRDYFLHLIFIVREAEKTIPEDQHTLVMVFDTTGLGMNHVRTDIVSQFGEMLKYFPARMGYALLLNISSLTRILLKPAIHLTGHQDDVVIMNRRDIERQLGECFGPELVHWMLCEMERNRRPKVPFCSAPENPDHHDPRGETAYVENYVNRQHPSGHRPHPSIFLAD